MSSNDDGGAINHRPRRPHSWAGTSMQGCAPTEEVQDKLKRARDNKERLDILVAEYGTASSSYAKRLRCVQFTPQDVVQQAFFKIACRQALDRYVVSRAWMITCLRNAWRDLCNKHRVHPGRLDPELEAAAVDDFNTADLLQTVQGIIARLASSLGDDPARRALFEDWRHRKLDLPFDDSELQAQFGDLLSSKRHRFAERYDTKLARLLCTEFGVDRLEEIKESLNRRSSPPPKDEESAATSPPPRDEEQTNGSTTTYAEGSEREDA